MAPRSAGTLAPVDGDLTSSPRAFLKDEHTLFLIGSASGASAMGGFLAALLNDNVEVARAKALAS